MSKNGRPDRNVWIIIKRTINENPIYSFFISNASDDTKLPIFVWLSGLRWSIEQCFKETKSELGMDHYEVRKYSGWNHHIQTCILANFFLWHLKIRLGEKTPSITLSQVRILLEIVLPIKRNNIESPIDLVLWIQTRNHKSYLSHKRKKFKTNKLLL